MYEKLHLPYHPASPSASWIVNFIADDFLQHVMIFTCNRVKIKWLANKRIVLLLSSRKEDLFYCSQIIISLVWQDTPSNINAHCTVTLSSAILNAYIKYHAQSLSHQITCCVYSYAIPRSSIQGSEYNWQYFYEQQQNIIHLIIIPGYFLRLLHYMNFVSN